MSRTTLHQSQVRDAGARSWTRMVGYQELTALPVSLSYARAFASTLRDSWNGPNMPLRTRRALE